MSNLLFTGTAGVPPASSNKFTHLTIASGVASASDAPTLLYFPLTEMSTIQQDFDRIALVSEDGAAHNDHYHNFLLRHLPSPCYNVLEIGCGAGGFARRLAERSEHVLALDQSPEMIRLARERSTEFTNIDYELSDVCDRILPDESFDCIATIATLHHVPYAEILSKLKTALKPGGVLVILDLFEPEGLSDSLLNLLAVPASVGLRLLHHGRLLPRREVRAAWKAHEAHDLYPTMNDVRALCARLLPGAKIRKHLLWRYSIVWVKPSQVPKESGWMERKPIRGRAEGIEEPLRLHSSATRGSAA